VQAVSRPSHAAPGDNRPHVPLSYATANEEPDLQNILRFVVRLSQVYRKIDLYDSDFQPA